MGENDLAVARDAVLNTFSLSRRKERIQFDKVCLFYRYKRRAF